MGWGEKSVSLPGVGGALDGLLAVLPPGPGIGRWRSLALGPRSVRVPDGYRHDPLLYGTPTVEKKQKSPHQYILIRKQQKTNKQLPESAAAAAADMILLFSSS